MIVGYVIGCGLNGKWVMPKGNSQYFCTICGSKIQRKYEASDLKISQRADLTITADGFPIVTERFKSFLLSNCRKSAATFYSLRNSKTYYILRANKSLPFDHEKVGTRFISLCIKCDQYESVVGISPPKILGISKLPKNSLFRTDLEFASMYEKAPCLIISPDLKERMNAIGFRGIDYTQIAP